MLYMNIELRAISLLVSILFSLNLHKFYAQRPTIYTKGGISLKHKLGRNEKKCSLEMGVTIRQGVCGSFNMHCASICYINFLMAVQV